MRFRGEYGIYWNYHYGAGHYNFIYSIVAYTDFLLDQQRKQSEKIHML